jgi:hypothetical protein
VGSWEENELGTMIGVGKRGETTVGSELVQTGKLITSAIATAFFSLFFPVP